MPSSKSEAEQILDEYLQDASEIYRGQYTTDELSSYPGLRTLFDEFGSLTTPTRTTVASPTAIEDDHPDLAVYEDDSQVLVAAVEAKGPNVGKEKLLDLGQGRRYARSFGGGHVLLTNLWQVVWAELDEEAGELVERDAVDLVDNPGELGRKRPRSTSNAAHELLALLDAVGALRSTIEDAERVATLLAYHATKMLEKVEASDDAQDLLRPLAESLREGLGMDLDDEFFTSTIVQTIVYGLFIGWLNSPDPKDYNYRRAEEHLEVPIIAELFHEILGPSFVRQCDLRPRLESAARVLKWVDRESFEEQFDNYAIEYFYEPFLAQFDPDLRDSLGVWYTPREIARYQVERVDHHLRDDLGIEEGLASEQVLILDPAVGTGTYLSEVLRYLFRYHHEYRGEPESIAAAKTLEAAIHRVIGFEILPAAMVICHLHLQRYLSNLGISFPDGERLRIYLTNSLLGWGADDEAPPSMPLPGLEKELRASLEVKADEPVLAVLGNPPYEGYSAAETEEEKALVRDWIDGLWEEFGVRKHRLGNLYVRFWSIGLRKIADLTGRGVVSYITDRKWLGGRSFPIMRRDITSKFHEIIVDDLHGEVHDTGHPNDGSVFTTETAPGIQQGVAVTTAVRREDADPEGGVARVRRRDFRGPGNEKRKLLEELGGNRDIDDGLTDHEVGPDTRWKLVPDSAGDAPRLGEYFHFYNSAVQPVREDAVMDTDREELEDRMRAYFDPERSNTEFFDEYPAFDMDRERYAPSETRSALLGGSRFVEERIVPFLYKPFDGRWLYWEPDEKLLNEARRQLVPYFLRSTQSGYEWIDEQCTLVASQTPRRPSGPQPLVTSGVAGFECVDPNARILPRLQPLSPDSVDADLDQMSVFGFDDEGEEDDGEFATNIRPEWLRAVQDVGFSGSNITLGDVIFYNLVAVTHSQQWLDGIGTDNDDFPGVPLPSSRSVLESGQKLGQRIASLADPFADVEGVTAGRIDSELRGVAVPDQTDQRAVQAGNRYRGGTFADGAVMWDDEHGWRGVPEEVWEYRVGGFPVLPKWLGYRHADRGAPPLSDEDLESFTHICRRLAALIELEDACDKLYQDAKMDPLEAVQR